MKKILTALLLNIAITAPAFAEDCRPYFAGIFTHEPVDLKVHVARLRLNDNRNNWVSFGMDQNYQNGASGMGDYNDHFIARTTGGGVYDVIQGTFTELFSDRANGNGVTDMTTLELRQDGTASVRLDSWGGNTFPLINMDCYRINDNSRQFVLSAFDNGGPYTKWLFSIERL